VCLEAIETPASIGRIVEVTSNRDEPQRSMADWLAASA
jgi:hypothetical protein